MPELTYEDLVKKTQRLSSALENVMDGVAIFNTQHEVVYSNKMWATIHGYEQMDVLGKKDLEFFPSEVYENHFLPLLDQAKTCDKVSIETVQLKKDGTPMPSWMEISCTKDSDNITGYSMTIKDLTEQKHIEFDISEKMQIAEKLNKVMVNRELKMVELKSRIKELEDEVVKLNN